MAGLYAISNRLAIKSAVVLAGAGPSLTFIVQHARANIIEITAPGVTIEDLNLNNATYNATPPVLKNPDPLVLFSNASDTTILSVTGEAGSGFGVRVTGPNPCAQYPTTGTVVSNLQMATTGRGGFASVDIDCTNGATLSNITIRGGILALYRDENVTLNGEVFTPGEDNVQCEPAAYITGPANDIAISDVTSSGGGVEVKQPALSVVVRGVTAGAGCSPLISRAAPLAAS
jgi:hypothetical protein